MQEGKRLIGLAIKRGPAVYAYDESGKTLCSKSCGRDGDVMGYTGTSFAVRKGNTVTVYDWQGTKLYSKSC